MGEWKLDQCINAAAGNDVIINTIAISYPSSQYMDSLIPITGGMSYSDASGIDALTRQITSDLVAQRQAVQDIAAGDSDGDGLPDSEEVGGMLATNGKTYHTNPYAKDTDGDGFTGGIKQFGNNWIDFSNNPSVCYYDGRAYYEISYPEYYKIEGDYELMDKYFTGSGKKANIFSYYLPSILVRRVSETRDNEGIPLALCVSALEGDERYYKLAEEENK